MLFKFGSDIVGSRDIFRRSLCCLQINNFEFTHLFCAVLNVYGYNKMDIFIQDDFRNNTYLTFRQTRDLDVSCIMVHFASSVLCTVCLKIIKHFL